MTCSKAVVAVGLGIVLLGGCRAIASYPFYVPDAAPDGVVADGSAWDTGHDGDASQDVSRDVGPDRGVDLPGDVLAVDIAPAPEGQVVPDFPQSVDADACGNGVVDAWETCDTGISAGQAGACPTVCLSATECKQWVLSGSNCQAVCVEQKVGDGGPCKDGTCHDGVCCKGCWDGTKCRTGTSLALCGDMGANCVSCDDSNPCTSDSCTAAGKCAHGNDDTATCAGGTCHEGACCTGCWDSLQDTCRPGNTAGFCGAGGIACAFCSPGVCQTPTCTSSGTCGTKPAPNGTPCPGGKCHGGQCCKDCWNGSACVEGTSKTACGTGGEACKSCSVYQMCSPQVHQCVP